MSELTDSAFTVIVKLDVSSTSHEGAAVSFSYTRLFVTVVFEVSVEHVKATEYTWDVFSSKDPKFKADSSKFAFMIG